MLIMLTPPFMFSKEDLDRAKNLAKEYDLSAIPSQEVTKEHVESAEIIFGWPKIEWLKDARHLKWLHLPSAGADHYNRKEVYGEKEVVLTTSGGTFGKPMAEHAIALIFAFNRAIHAYVRNGERAHWEKVLPVRDFFGSTVGIIGLGDIGRETAKRCKALGAYVIAVKRTLSEKPDYVDELYTESNPDPLLERADVVVIALPDTPKTRGFLSKERIAKLKKTAFVVNLGRGSAIDQDALIEALREERIAGAGLDVTVPEPLPKDNPLWSMPNVIITCHSSGLSPTSINRNFEIFMTNLEKYLAKEPMNNVVDFNEGY
jgi:phosphoglycerate dehydrogenase-like enzyme